MKNLQDLIDTNGTPVGKLAAFRLLKDTELIKSDSSGDGNLIASMWQARGGLPFRLPQGKKTTVVFLSDVEFFPVHEMAIGERKGTKGAYPQTEFIRSLSILGVGDNGETLKSGEKCVIEQALGRGPKLIAVAKILDTTPFKTKDGKEVPWSIRCVIIPSNSSLLSVLTATSEVAKTSIQYMVFSVQRSMNEKSPRIGDSWTYTGKRIPDILTREGVAEAAASIDLAKGFPVLTRDQALPLIRKHVALSNRFSGENKNAVLTYDERAVNALFNNGETTAAPSILETQEKPKAGFLSLEDLADHIDADPTDDGEAKLSY